MGGGQQNHTSRNWHHLSVMGLAKSEALGVVGNSSTKEVEDCMGWWVTQNSSS
jgi:hypothetical protein